VIKDDYVGDIGNNVTLKFRDFDFEDGVSKIGICGRTPLDVNTIHIIFSNEEGVQRRLIDFGGSNEFAEQIFDIEDISGRNDVEFLFLPGSKFDFRSFRFFKK